MASSTPVMCGPCEAEKDSTKASIWCNNCEEGLCSICCDQHKKFKTTRDHKTVDIDAYSKLPMFIRSIKTDCERHGLKLHLYCPNHLCPCCEVCVSSDHSNCVEIKSMTSVVQKENLEDSVHYLDYEIKSVLNVYEKIIISINESKEDRHKTLLGIRENTASIRKKINENLDRLETKLNSELSFIVNKEEAHERDVVREIERKKHNITEMQQHMNLLLKHSSKLQSFLGIYHLTQQVHQHQKFLDDKDNDNKIIAANIKLEQNVDFTRLVSSFESLEHLGKY
ncbi:unnamed protein product [Mytilus edulis]|uniref:B box-type domain-containing protein n=1 Tax=Mytilus edulis TaxID=6550 RepID=A0A8S3VGF7_MYTED|nr:unnamed protein product [Mytilus edulis]